MSLKSHHNCLAFSERVLSDAASLSNIDVNLLQKQSTAHRGN